MTKSSICQTHYLKNHTSYDSDLWYIRVKWIISPGVFFIFSKFWFFRLLGRSKGKKWPKMTRNYVNHTPYLRKHIIVDFWYTSVKWWHLQCFFNLFKILIFWVVKGLRVPKMTRNYKKLCLSLNISGTLPHMIVVFGTHV